MPSTANQTTIIQNQSNSPITQYCRTRDIRNFAVIRFQVFNNHLVLPQ